MIRLVPETKTSDWNACEPFLLLTCKHRSYVVCWETGQREGNIRTEAITFTWFCKTEMSSHWKHHRSAGGRWAGELACCDACLLGKCITSALVVPEVEILQQLSDKILLRIVNLLPRQIYYVLADFTHKSNRWRVIFMLCTFKRLILGT